MMMVSSMAMVYAQEFIEIKDREVPPLRTSGQIHADPDDEEADERKSIIEGDDELTDTLLQQMFKYNEIQEQLEHGDITEDEYATLLNQIMDENDHHLEQAKEKKKIGLSSEEVS